MLGNGVLTGVLGVLAACVVVCVCVCGHSFFSTYCCKIDKKNR